MTRRIEAAGSFREQAAKAWERFNPDLVSKPEADALRSAWIGGYLAALQDAGFEDSENDANRRGIPFTREDSPAVRARCQSG